MGNVAISKYLNCEIVIIFKKIDNLKSTFQF